MVYMKTTIQNYKTVGEWKQTLGENIRNLRLLKNIDQRDLAAMAGVSTTAVKRLESGKTSTTETLIRVVRILGRTDWLESLAPPVSVNPMLMLHVKGPRKKIYKPRKPRLINSD